MACDVCLRTTPEVESVIHYTVQREGQPKQEMDLCNEDEQPILELLDNRAVINPSPSPKRRHRMVITPPEEIPHEGRQPPHKGR